MANIQERRDKAGKLISYSIRYTGAGDLTGSSSSPGRPLLRYHPPGRKKAQEKRLRLSPQPLRKNAERV